MMVIKPNVICVLHVQITLFLKSAALIIAKKVHKYRNLMKIMDH